MIRRCLVCIAALCLAAALRIPPVHADVIFDNFNTNGTFSPTNNSVAASASHLTSSTTASRAAAQFTVTGGDFSLSSITLPISQQNTVAGNYLRVRITTDNAGAPGTTLETLSDGDVWPSFANPFTTTTTLNSVTHPVLSNGASYWIVTELNAFPSLSSPGQSVDYRWFANTSGATVPFRQQQLSGGLPQDPWTGFQGPASVAFRVNGLPAGTACLVETGSVSNVSYTWTSPDAWTDVYWQIPRSSCTACGPSDDLMIKSVSFKLHWFGACTAQARLSVVGVQGSVCETPDTSLVLCSPVSYPITASGTATTYTLAPVGDCCITQDAFVRIQLVGLADCYPSSQSPAFYATNTACSACALYYATSVSHPDIADWCSGEPNLLWVRVQADCCSSAGVGGEPVADAATLSVIGSPSRSVRIDFTLAGSQRRHVDLEVFDLLGRRVQRLVSADLDPGKRSVRWDGSSNSGRAHPGVYQVRLRAGGTVRRAKLILIQ